MNHVYFVNVCLWLDYSGFDDFISDRKLKLLLAIYIQQVRSRQFQVVWKSFELEAAMLEQELFKVFIVEIFVEWDNDILSNIRFFEISWKQPWSIKETNGSSETLSEFIQGERWCWFILEKGLLWAIIEFGFSLVLVTDLIKQTKDTHYLSIESRIA